MSATVPKIYDLPYLPPRPLNLPTKKFVVSPNQMSHQTTKNQSY